VIFSGLRDDLPCRPAKRHHHEAARNSHDISRKTSLRRSRRCDSRAAGFLCDRILRLGFRIFADAE
jgi:hypothetical protein